MVRFLSALLLVVVVACGVSSAYGGSFGLGIILGEPTGISFKQWVSTRHAFAGAAAWSFGNVSAFHVHLDYLYHGPLGVGIESGGFLYYVGIGGRLKAVEDDSRIGVRVPLGLNYVFDDAPIDLFFEIAPILDVVPSTDFRMNGSLGIRYFF